MNCAERLVSIFGSQAEVARRFRLDRAVVTNWVKSGYVPARWAMEVERATEGKVAAVEVLDEALAPRPTFVFNSSFIRGISLLGLNTLVKTQDGPQKT